MNERLFLACIQLGAMSVIGAYVVCSLGMAVHACRQGQPFVLAERGTPWLRSFGDWAPKSLRLLMSLRRAALVAVVVLLGTGSNFF